MHSSTHFHNYQYQLKSFISDRFTNIYSSRVSTHSVHLLTTRLTPLSQHMNNNDVQSQYAFDALHKLYRFTYSHLINNWTRSSKRHLLPLSFDFLDDPRSKPTNARIKTFNETPHIHSILLLRHEHRKPIQEILKPSFYHQIRTIESLHLTSIEPSEELKTLSYASKLLEHPIALNTPLFDFNPHPFKTSSEFMPHQHH